MIGKGVAVARTALLLQCYHGEEWLADIARCGDGAVWMLAVLVAAEPYEGRTINSHHSLESGALPDKLFFRENI